MHTMFRYYSVMWESLSSHAITRLLTRFLTFVSKKDPAKTWDCCTFMTSTQWCMEISSAKHSYGWHSFLWAKLTDFGRSFKVSPDDMGSITHDVGAIQSKAPELIEIGAYGSNVYSFGMCVLEAVKGGLPWGTIRMPL